MSQQERLTDLLKQADEHSANRCITDFEHFYQSQEETKKKYKKCTDCPRYKECFRTADLRRKRRHCTYADLSRSPKERSKP